MAVKGKLKLKIEIILKEMVHNQKTSTPSYSFAEVSM